MDTTDDISSVLAHYPALADVQRVEPLGGAGGFSGALFWKVETEDDAFCVRRWPQEHPNRERLEFIQAVLWHVHQEAFYLVPLPLETESGGGYVRYAEHFWEAAPWMPGRADYHQTPTVEKLSSALTGLAEFHVAASSFPVAQGRPAPSPGLAQRFRLAADLRGGMLLQLREAMKQTAWPELDRRAARVMELIPRALAAIDQALLQCLDTSVSLQPCIRDIWHDHVLFLDGQLSGIVDFGAMRVDNVAADIARLLGSLVGDEREGWMAGLAAYESVRPISEPESRLIKAFDRSNVALSLVNWLRWVYFDRREFEKREAIEARFDELLPRLERLTELG